MPFSSATIFVGGGVIVFFLPVGLSGLQIRYAGGNPDCISFFKTIAANSGVPKKMYFGFLLFSTGLFFQFFLSFLKSVSDWPFVEFFRFIYKYNAV